VSAKAFADVVLDNSEGHVNRAKEQLALIVNEQLAKLPTVLSP
jgi:hypothetical protein